MPPKRSSGSSHKGPSSRPSSSRSSSSSSSSASSSRPTAAKPSRPASAGPSRPAAARPDRPVSRPDRPAQPQRPPRGSAVPNIAPILYAEHQRRKAQNAYNQGYMAGSMNNGQPLYNDGYNSGYDNHYEQQPQPVEQRTCDYCGLLIADPNAVVCPSCGAPLGDESQSIPQPEMYNEPPRSDAPERSSDRNKSSAKTSKKKSPIRFIILGLVLIFIIMTVLKLGGAKRDHSDPSSNTAVSAKTFHADVLGRDLPYNEEYDAYYDKETDCYLVDQGNGTYQYWYEGISSDFGDFGWMEYDAAEGKWYIEQDQNDWVELPAEYDSSTLWHIEE